jgi:predicted DsbA family dithiol-disulfide isomerase
MNIEIFSDIVCPWCYIGLAELERALAERPALSVQLHWLPFELNPDLPSEGRDRREYLLERFGREDPFRDAQQPLIDRGAQLGLQFRFERVQRAPNTRRAHMLVAASPAHASALTRALMRSHFELGGNLSDPDSLIAVAESVGIAPDVARRSLDDAQLGAAVAQIEASARASGIQGVPTFIFERRHAFSGAQPAAAFHRVFDRLTA